ncbi:MAG: head maturation protease, ClpP-related [Pseudonocardiaceae bacterium]
MALTEPTDPVTATSPATSADVYVYDVIGGWFGMTAEDFVRDVAALDVEQIVLHLNTPGGDAIEGVAIANVLRAHKARIVVRVDGYAASAGSVIAMAGDEVIMGIGSEMMVHDSWGYAWGNAADMAAYGRRLDVTSNSLASTYASRAGGTTQEWRAIMQAETWYTAEEAVTAGLADRVATADETGTAEGEQIVPGSSQGDWWGLWDSLKATDRFDLSAFNYAGRAQAPAPRVCSSQPERGRAVAFSDDQLSEMRQSLGLADDADETAILAALSDRLATPPDPSLTPAPALPEGTVAIDSSTLASLQAAAQRGEDARTRQEQEDRERLVSAAIEDGRIPPARREHWLTQLEADPGAADTLAALAPGLIPVGAPIGHAGGSDAVDPLYEAVFGKDA